MRDRRVTGRRYPVPGLPGIEVGVRYRRWCVWRNGRLVPSDLSRPARYVDEHGNRVRRSTNRLLLDSGAIEIVGHVIDREWFPSYRLDWSAEAGDWRVRSYAVASPNPPGSFTACYPHDYDARPCCSIRNAVTRLNEARQVGWVACLTWHGRPPAGANNACHRDGNPFRNGHDNLYWGSSAENAYDREKHRAARHARERVMTADELIWGDER